MRVSRVVEMWQSAELWCEDPVDSPLRRHRHPGRAAQQLQPDPLGTPPGMLAAHLCHHDLDLTRDLVRAKARPVGLIRQPSQPLSQIPGHPRMHRLPRHPASRSHLGTLAPDRTARTASSRCSTTDNTTSANLGLLTSDVPRNVTDRKARARANVKHQLAGERQASPGTGHGDAWRIGE
jgi:hypothetical protein